MRDYGKVYTAFWSNEDVRSMSDDGRMMALYIMTCPHGNMLGCFRLPVAYVAEDLRWDSGRVSKGFEEVFRYGFAYHCKRSSWLFIRKHLEWNPLENPNVGKAAGKLFDSLTMTNDIKALLVKALRSHSQYFPADKLNHFDTLSIPFQDPFETLSKPVAVAVAVTKQEQKPEPKPNPIVELPPDRSAKEGVVTEIFAYWQRVMGSPGSKLDDKRRKLIEGALKNYQPREICLAIQGCSRTPHNMGENDRNTKYNGLNVILRDADQIDRFIGAASRAPTAPKGQLSIEEQNKRSIAEFLGAGTEPDDLNTIDMEMSDASE